ncbi:MAG: hypothetical protein KAI47_15485, partial [Deltaproteobacteria bacterium]|nr:hypothetical protein [Deltaproteobacteria bacterium]
MGVLTRFALFFGRIFFGRFAFLIGGAEAGRKARGAPFASKLFDGRGLAAGAAATAPRPEACALSLAFFDATSCRRLPPFAEPSAAF